MLICGENLGQLGWTHGADYHDTQFQLNGYQVRISGRLMKVDLFLVECQKQKREPFLKLLTVPLRRCRCDLPSYR